MTRKTTIISALAGVLSAIGATTANAQTIGTTVRADLTVTGSQSGVLSSNSDIHANERIQADATGLGHFQFNDGAKMVVGPGTNLVLDEVVYNPDGSTFRRLALDTTAGALRFISGSSQSNNYEIRTPVGTLGLRGTAFDMHHYRGRTYILLVEGGVQFCANNGQCETIERKCDYVVAHPDGRVTPPVQPVNGIYGSRDMGRFFPFIADQRQIEEGFRLRIATCGGGSASGQFGGPAGGTAGPGIGIGGGNSGSGPD